MKSKIFFLKKMADVDNFASSLIINLAEAKPAAAAAVAGISGALVLGMSGNEAIVWGATTALGVSLGDAVLTGAGYNTQVQTYFGKHFSSYVDPIDFVGGALGVGAINLALGVRGESLAVMVGLGAVAGGIAPKVSGWVLSKMLERDFQQTEKPTTGSQGAGGSSVTA